ncbi:MAG: hypothetical protein HY368_01815 [Candidatus Aenigmarchaeota archaeon]|nr:hypothetical protein [Candidatus Aenigmarchaeota archaeon]
MEKSAQEYLNENYPLGFVTQLREALNKRVRLREENYRVQASLGMRIIKYSVVIGDDEAIGTYSIIASRLMDFISLEYSGRHPMAEGDILLAYQKTGKEGSRFDKWGDAGIVFP